MMMQHVLSLEIILVKQTIQLPSGWTTHGAQDPRRFWMTAVSQDREFIDVIISPMMLELCV